MSRIRLKLHLEGVSLPPRSSVENYVLCKFIIQQETAEIRKAYLDRLLLDMVVGTFKSKSAEKVVLSAWKDYLSAKRGDDFEASEPDGSMTPDQMLAEYNKMKDLTPTIKYDPRSQKLKVHGLK